VTPGPLTIIGSQVTAVPRVPTPMVAVPAAAVRPDGSFDIGGVAPGSYTVYAESGPGQGVTPIDVSAADVDNVVVALTNGINIPGRITVERGSSGAGAIDFSTLRFLLERDPDVVGTPAGGPSFSPPPETDGTFTLMGVKPGDYRVSLPPILVRASEISAQSAGRPVPLNLRHAYVKSMRWGRADVLADGLHTWSATQGPLDVVISLSAAELEGTVRDNSRERSRTF